MRRKDTGAELLGWLCARFEALSEHLGLAQHPGAPLLRVAWPPHVHRVGVARLGAHSACVQSSQTAKASQTIRCVMQCVVCGDEGHAACDHEGSHSELCFRSLLLRNGALHGSELC